MAHQHLRQRVISSGQSPILGRFCTAATATAASRVSPDKRRGLHKARLYNKLWVAGSNNCKMSDVLNELKRQGKGLSKTDLISCVKDLRKHSRYHNCLEILEWMENHTNDSSDGEQALRLSIVCKLRGIDEAEKYFASLPDAAKTSPTYGALLNCYCAEKLIDKALAHFKEMDELNFANAVAFNNLMGLYMKVGQPEKVPPLVQEMKQKNIQLTSYSYGVLIQSYGCLNDLDGVERVANEVQLQNKTTRDWTIYSCIAAAYIRAGQSEKSKAALKKLEQFLDSSYNPDRAAYNHLISLCANSGNSEYVTRVWDKLKSRFKSCNNLSYLNMLYSLSRLNDVEGMKKCLQEWELSYQMYDVRLPIAVIDTCLKSGMIEEAELLLKDATRRAGEQTWKSHVSLMKYYLGKHQIDSALRHMELAIDNRWKQFRANRNLFLEYFMKEKDVDGAEKFCHALKKAQALDSRVYLGLLQTYAFAEKMAPDMRWRIEKDDVAIGPEHEKLLQKICPN